MRKKPKNKWSDKLLQSLSLLTIAVGLYNSLLPTMMKLPAEVMVLIVITLAGALVLRSL